MTLNSKYKPTFEDIIRYAYNELEDNDIQLSIKELLDNSDVDTTRTLRDINLVKLYRGFKNANEHIDKTKSELAVINKKMFAQVDEILEKETHIATSKQPKIRRINTRYIVAMAATLLIIVVAAIVLLRPPNNELTAFVDDELQTNELPTLPSNYEIVLSSDEPKELAELYKNRDYDKAISVIKEEIVKTDNQDLTLFLGVCYLRNGKSKKAIKYLEPIAQGASAYKDDAKIELAYAYIKVGEYQKAYNLATDLKANGSEFYQDEADILLQKIIDFKPEINQN